MFKDPMIQASLWSNILYTMCFPSIHLYLMNGINSNIISVNQILICISVIVVNSIWNKYSNRLYKYYIHFMALESVAYLILNLTMILNICTTLIYYLTDTFLYCIITKNIICGSVKLRSFVYNKDKREKYDNTAQIATAIGTLIGSTIAIIINIPIEIAFIISWIGITIDNIFYIIAYRNAETIKH